MVRLTSARPSAAFLAVPAKMTSSIFWERTADGAWAPSTQAMASTTLDLPEPLGPTTTVTPGSSPRSAVSANDLKPLMVRFLRNTVADGSGPPPSRRASLRSALGQVWARASSTRRRGGGRPRTARPPLRRRASGRRRHRRRRARARTRIACADASCWLGERLQRVGGRARRRRGRARGRAGGASTRGRNWRAKAAQGSASRRRRGPRRARPPTRRRRRTRPGRRP